MHMHSMMGGTCSAAMRWGSARSACRKAAGSLALPFSFREYGPLSDILGAEWQTC